MLKTASAVGPTMEIGDQEQDGKKIQVENRDEKEPIQKSCKSQQTAKSKKWIRAEKSEAARAKTLVTNQHRSSPPKQIRPLPN